MTTTVSRRSASPVPAPPSPPASARPGGRAAPSSAAAGDALATLALTVLTLAGVFSVNRLFVNRSFAGPVVFVAVGAHVVAWWCRRQSWPPAVATIVSLAALVFLVSWAVLPGSTTFGLPLATTFRAAGQSFSRARLDFHLVNAPAPVTQGFVLVVATGVGVLATLADWAAFRMRATLEATVPSFAAFIFCAVIGTRSGRSAAIIVEAAALLAFVMIHQATINQETSAWFANRTQGALTSALSTGLVIGLASLVVALNLGFRLPGATHKAVINWRGDVSTNGTRSTLSPLVDLHGRLLHPSPNPVFTVASSQPEYWRETALDTFNGTDWNALSTYHSVGATLSEGSTPTVGGARVEQDFTITDLNAPWLPAAYRPVSVSGIKGITYDPQSGNLISDNNVLTGATYHVTSVVSQGDAESARLEAAPPPSKSTVAHFLDLPPLHSTVVNLAKQIVAGKTTEYDKALAIQNYLRDPSNFTYTLDYNYSGPNPLDNFLFVAKAGYCQQFAGSFAVLARAVGVPTRLAVGWTWGQEVSPGLYRVTDQNLHTWPEVYFTGVGWVAFEPTPGRGIPGGQNYTGVAAAESGPSASLSTGTGTTVPVTTSGGAASRPTTTSSVPLPGTAPKKHHANRWLGDLVWLGSLLSAVALVVALILTLRWLQAVATRDRLINQAAELEADGRQSPRDRFARFRREWAGEGRPPFARWARRLKAILLLGWLLPMLPSRHRPPPLLPEVVNRAEVLLTWSELLDLLAWWGVRRRPSETYRELAHRAALELRGPLSLEPTSVSLLLGLAEAATKAEFGVGSITPEEADGAAANLAVVKRALLRSATSAQRIRLVVDPRFTVKVR